MKTIKEMTWMEFDELRKETGIAVIPIGATEVYGPHLPLGSDIIVCEEVSKRIAEKLKLLIGPSITVGDSKCLDEFPGTMVARPESFENYLMDICESLIKWGYKKFFFFNSHVTNVSLIEHICEKLTDRGFLCAQIDWWRFVKPISVGIADFEGEKAHGHASEVGTSCMLYLREDLVVKEKMEDQESLFENPFPDFITYEDFSEYTKSGILGMASAATREKGEKIVEKAIDRIIEFLTKEFQAESR
ncbi:MAG: creatininase family protein [Lachnospiraceae bacterium]